MNVNMDSALGKEALTKDQMQPTVSGHSEEDGIGTIDEKTPRTLSRSLQGRHMQMIAIGAALGVR